MELISSTTSKRWEGQPKGLLQVLWEQELIDESNKELASYTVDGQKDPIARCIDTRSSLRHLVANCTDFKHEETAFQHLGAQLGVTVLLTQKLYAELGGAELAGEGVEYCWAHAKSHYRCMPVLS